MEQTKKQFRYRGANSTGSAWHYANSPDDLKTAGHYTVCLSHDDLLVIGVAADYCSKEHTIVAQLFVTESAVADKQQQGRVVGQTLVLAACDGATVEILSRTAEKQAHGFVWQPWSRMSQNIELGEVTSLDDYTESGTYKGVFTNGKNKYETFIMVIINNAPVAQATGKVRCISQFKYALGTDSNFSYKTRTGRGDDDIEWGDWVDLGAATTSDIQDCAITAQKLSTDLLAQINNNTAAITAERTRAMGQEELLNNAYETEKTRALQAEAEAIEKGKQLALRALFVAAGAEYNDSGADITKTAPWGETVTHKAGHYYLNGLGDITEEQMIAIYINKNYIYMLDIGRVAQGYKKIRTIMGFTNALVSDVLGKRSFYGLFSFAQTKIEVFFATDRVSIDSAVSEQTIPCNSLYGTFFDCSFLRIVYPINVKNVTDIPKSTFSGCTALKELRLNGLKVNLDISDSMNVSKKSVLYLIQNATPSSAKTITLHPEAYARLADDADIVVALEAQPLVSLVSA